MSADFAKLVPGFDFLQGLMKNAGAGLPNMGQWIAPTLDPAELDKRIGELRTVQYWLEQNARMLAATIQALEVQRMTLATLKTMNMPLEGVRESMLLRPPPPAPTAAAERAAAPPRAATHVAAPAAAPDAATRAAPSAAAGAAPGAGPTAAPAAVDPLQWWGALTQQFTELATTAMKDAAPVVPAATAKAKASAKTARAPRAAPRPRR